MRSLKTVVRQPDPPPTGWDRLCTAITCHSFLQRNVERVAVDMGHVAPLLVRLAAVTQVPGALAGACGQPTQLVLPCNLDCTVDGHADEPARTVRLDVRADKPCEVIAWWPEAWGKGAVRVAGPEPADLSPVPNDRYVTYGQERFVRVALPRGRSTVVVRPAR